MIRKNNKCTITLFAGVFAAAVTVLGIGGYFLHKKVLNSSLREQARRQAMNRSMSNDYDIYEYEDGDEDYTDDLFEDFDNDGFDNLINEIKQGDEDR